MKARIEAALKELAVPFAQGGESDFTFNLVLADDKWRVGKKRKTFEGSVLVDDERKTVFYWERIVETKSGLSMGVTSEHSVQKGSVVERTVAETAYGPGVVSETRVDFGKIAKAVKNAAKQGGYKYKLVLSRKKARY